MGNESSNLSDIIIGRATIMAVDDDPINTRVLSKILLAEGYQVRAENNALSALKNVLTDPPDLILLDIKMPDMDGITFCQKLKKDTAASNIPVIFISSLEEPEKKVSAFNAGGSDYLTKPFSNVELLARVRTQLHLSRLQTRLKQLVELRTAELKSEIARHKKAKEKLKTSKTKYKDMINLNPLMSFELDQNGTINTVNREAARQLGFTPAELVGQPVSIVFPENQHEAVYAQLDDCIQEPHRIQKWEITKKHKNGSLMWVSETAILIQSDQRKPTILIMCENISERKIVEEKLKESEARLSGVLWSAAEAVISIDESQHITLFNKSAEKVFGYSQEEVFGQPLELLLPDKYHTTHKEHVANFSNTQERGRYMADRSEIEGRRKNGDAFPIEASISKLEIDGKKTFTAVLRDISRRKQNEKKLHGSFIESISTLMRAAEYRDDETGSHVKRISYYTKVLAETLGMDDNFCEDIFHASAMHDIGKIGIPDHILLKPGDLTPEESNIMKTHTIIGGKIMAGNSSPYLQLGMQIALSHHERWDGGGYPFGLKGDAIPLAARIMQLADVYDALRSKRPYKKAFDHEKSLEIITKGDGRTDPSHFDPAVLAAFQQCADIMNEIFDERREEEEL